MRESLWKKLLVLFLGVFLCSIAGLTYFAYRTSRDATLEEFEIRGRELTSAIASESRVYYRNLDVERFTTTLQSIGEAEGVVAILAYDASKALWIESSIIELTRSEIVLPEEGVVWHYERNLAKGAFVNEFGRAIQRRVDTAEPQARGSAPPIGWIRVFLDRAPLEQRLGALVVKTVLISALTMMFGGAIFVFLLRQSIKMALVNNRRMATSQTLTLN